MAVPPADRIAFFGGSFNPPTAAHRAVVAHLLADRRFHRVIVKPCGRRPDKPELGGTDTRGADTMRRAFVVTGAEPGRLVLDLSAMDRPMVPTWQEWRELSAAWAPREVWLACGLDLFVREAGDACQVERWVEGGRLFREAPFLVFPRPVTGEPVLPPRHELASGFAPMDVSSSALRARAAGTAPA